jgi:tRNA (guanine37-N1)-methyltransferase
MQIGVVSLLPELVETVLQFGVVGRAAEREIVALHAENPRDYADDVHRTVDDRPYGGGPGMVMKYEPVARALQAAKAVLPGGSTVIHLTPAGRPFDQQAARRLAAMQGFVLLSGRYEGIDERLIESQVDEELSLGDFVLSGGEIAAMAVIDAVVRLLPGVLGDDESAAQDSFMAGLLDCPHYTRPEEIEGRSVPAVLLSGDHARIARWREKQALGRSYLRRPELLENLDLSREQQALLDEFLQEMKS